MSAFGKLLPFSLVGHLDGVASPLAKHVNRVVLARECGRQVFAAKVVDELQGGLMVILDFARRNHPAERVVLLAQIAGQRSVELLPRNGDVLLVEIDAQIDIIFIII